MNIEEVRQKYPQYNDLSDDQLLQGLHQKYYSDMPVEQFMANFQQQAPESYGEPIQNEQGQYQIGGPVQLDIGKDIIAPVVEPAIALATGGAAETAGTILGGLEAYPPQGTKFKTGNLSGNASPLKGSEMRDRVSGMFTYQPRTEGAQQVMQGYGEALQPVGEMISKGRLGEEALAAGLPDWLAQNAEAIPESIMALFAGLGLRRPAKPAIKTDKAGKLPACREIPTFG